MRDHKVVVMALALASVPLCAQSMEEMRLELERSRATQERMMEMMSQQAQRIDMLERQLQQGAVPGVTPAAPGDRPMVDLAKPDAAAPSPSDPVLWSDVMGKGQRFRLYGFARVDAIYDDSRPNSTHTIGFVRSEDSTAPGTIGAPDDVNSFTVSPNLTRVGLDLTGPEIEALGNVKPSGKIEVDFYAANSSPSRPEPRMRHGYAKLTWGDFSVLGGQTFDVISPLYPSVNPDLAMWGAGNLGDRRPQIRLEWKPMVGPGRMTISQMLGTTGANDNQDLDAAGTTGRGFLDGETSGIGTLQGRIAYALDFFEEKQKFEIGGWYHRAWEEPDMQFGGDDVFDSYALGLDLRLPIWKDRVWTLGEIWYGRNVDDVRGGIFQGINTTTGDEIYARGGWVELGVKLFPWWTVSGGYSTDDPTDGDLEMGGRVDNDIFYVTNRWKWDSVSFGFDWSNWETDYKGYDSGTSNRFQWSIQYDF